MLSVDEILDDFRRNGRECDFAPVQDPTDRFWSYIPTTLSWNAWPPEHYATSQEESTPFNVTSAHLKLARAISALSLAGTTASCPPQTQTMQRSPFCQHRGTNADRCGGNLNDLMCPAEKASVLKSLQGSSLIHNELQRLIHEKTQELSQEYRSARQKEEAHFLNSSYLVWNNQASHPMTKVSMQAPRNVPNSRGRNRANNWERYESGSISGRSSPVPRDMRFESRPYQPNPRNNSRHAFNRVANLKIPREAEIDRISKEPFAFPHYFPPTPSDTSSAPTTPEPLSTPYESPVREASDKVVPKAALNGPVAGRKPPVPQSAPVTPSGSSLGDASVLSSPETLPGPKSPLEPDPPKEAGGRPKGSQRRRRYSSESQPTAGCAFCKKNGETPSVYKNHIAKDADGRTVCRILQRYVCPLCGDTGEKAHTLKYCPQNLTPQPSLSERNRSSRIHPNRTQKKLVSRTN